MSETRPKRTLAIYLIIVWMAINTVLRILLIPGDEADLTNWVEPVLWVISIAGLLPMKKWGAVFTVAVLGITIGLSFDNVLLAYYSNLLLTPLAYVNSLRIILNTVAIAYLFKRIFANGFKR